LTKHCHSPNRQLPDRHRQHLPFSFVHPVRGFSKYPRLRITGHKKSATAHFHKRRCFPATQKWRGTDCNHFHIFVTSPRVPSFCRRRAHSTNGGEACSVESETYGHRDALPLQVSNLRRHPKQEKCLDAGAPDLQRNKILNCDSFFKNHFSEDQFAWNKHWFALEDASLSVFFDLPEKPNRPTTFCRQWMTKGRDFLCRGIF